MGRLNEAKSSLRGAACGPEAGAVGGSGSHGPCSSLLARPPPRSVVSSAHKRREEREQKYARGDGGNRTYNQIFKPV